MKTLIVVLLVLTMGLSGCLSPNLDSPAADMAAKSLGPPAKGMARIYVYRPFGIYGAAIKLVTFLDTHLVGQLTRGTFLLLEVPPATYTLTSSNLNSQEVVFTVNAGETVFFHEHGGIGGGVKYDRVSIPEGSAEI